MKAAPAAGIGGDAAPPPATTLSGASAPAGGGASSAKATADGGPGSPTAAGLLRLGAKLSERGDYPTAEIAYWQILNNPDLVPADEKNALLALAHMLRKQGDYTKAAAIYEKFHKLYSTDDRVPDALLELGRTLRDMGVYRLAISRFYSVINSTLKFPPRQFEHYQLLAKTAQFEIAQTHFDAGEYAEAGKFFSRVRLLDLAPVDRGRASFMEAYSQQLAGDLDRSVASLKTFLNTYPDDANMPEARYLLARTLRQLHRSDQALAVTLDLLRDEHVRTASDPQRWSYWQRRTGNEVANEFFQNGDTFDALAIYRGLSTMSADPRWRLPVTYQIALCYERLRQTDDARTAYRAIVAAAAPSPGRAAPSPDIAELAGMASWRLSHLDWRENADQQLNRVFAKPAGSKS